jgi:PKD repeat protein
VTLIARNECYCSDTTNITVEVLDGEAPQIDCIGTICADEIVTYTSPNACGEYYWNIIGNGVIVEGGATTDDYITVQWLDGPEGFIELRVEGCGGTECNQTTIERVPILTDGAPINGPEKVCVDDYATYTIPKYDGTEYTWSINGGGTIESGQGTNSIVVHWFGWFSEPVVRVDYESCYLGCGGFSELEVLIRNEFYISGPIEACENTSTTHNIELFFGAPADTWDWAVTDETGATVWTSPTAGDQTTVDWTFGPGLYTLSATANTPDNFCNDSYSTRIRVPESPPKPIDISGQTDICPGEPYTYEASSSIANDEYQWQIQDGSNTVIVEGNPIVYSWGASPPYVIAVAQIANSGPLCLSDTLQMDVQALTPPVIEPVADVCKEDIVIYQLSSFYPEETYDWTITPSTAGSIISGQGESTVEVLWHQTGVHTITAGLCNLDDSEAVTVHPTPEPEVNHPDGLCQGETEMVSTILTYSSYEWRDEGGAVLSTDPQPLLEPGTYELVVTNQFGCAGNTSFTIDSYDLPSVFISSPDDLGYCTGDPAAVLFASATGDGYTYQWFYNGNPVSTNPGLTAPGFGFYQVEVIDVNGCTALSNVLEIFENCDPVGGICNGNSTGFPQDCPEGTSIQFNIEPATDCAISTFTNVSPDFVPGTLEWYFDDGTTSLDQGPVVQHTYSQAGYYVVILTGISQSTGLFCYNTKLNIVPAVAAFDYEIACPNAPMQFRDYSTHVPTEDITGWDWDFGDPASGPNNFSTDQHPTHEFSVSGIFDVTLTVTSTTGCTNTITRQVEVAPIPTVDFPLPAPGCEGNAMDFEAVVDADVVEVEWDFDDPSTADANTSNLNSSFHIFSGPGSYDVTLLATNVFGCQNSITKTVTIEPNLLSGVITPSGPLTVCEGDGIFLNAEDPSQAAGTTFEWSTGEVGSEIFIDTENTYSVTVTDPQGCRYVPDPVTLDVVPDPNGSIFAVEYNEFGQAVANQYNGLSICEGEDVYLEITQAPGYTYQWSTGEFGTEIVFADWRGNPLPVGIHDFTVTITDTNTGCSNEVGPFIVTVNENPDPISITPDGILCENTLLNLTVNNPDPGLTYIWNTGETGTSIQVFTAGAYFVRGINASGCSTESNTLTVNPAPDLSSIPSGCLTRCDPDTICLPNIPFVDTYQWYLDGNPIPAPEGTDPDFIATESGTYFVELTDVFGCSTISNDLDLELYTGYGSLLGNVYFDVNQNGIIDGPDTLMPGIDIILLQNNIPQDTSTSNGQGSWAFPGILSVDYQLAVDTANLEPGFEALIVSEDISLVGCDDLETVDWLITGGCIQQTASLELGACTGETVNYNGQDLSIGSNTDFTLQTIDGCDSIVSVSVTELLPTAETFELQACEGTTIFYNGDPIPAGQQADFVLTNAAGCDSLLTVVVEAVSEYAIDVDLETCNGVPVMFDGTELTPGTITDFNYISSQGCDSTVTVEVIEFPKDSMGLQFQSCSGVEVPYNGMNLAPGTVTEFVFSNSNGCDSIVTVEVAELLPSSATEIFSACTGETVSYAGTNLNPGTVTEFVFTNAAGCDSTVTVTVDELVPTSDFIQLAACTGTTVNYNGNSLAPGTVTEFQFTNSVGCDSTVEVTVEELFGSIETLNLEACSGETVVYNNDVLNAGTTTTYTFQNADGCDSIVIVDVEELAVSFETLNLSACDGNTVFYNGMPLMPGSSTDFVFANTAGCDSTVTVNVIANQSSFHEI